ncbi:GST1 [Symbiodinium natans]|uniref:GST1 protein n=1 Tax=Symbiodinium natans TaxID=878477 RepID=A0A812U2W0_9DINO|nr:GST1 [Symbiodinium natans]
MKQTLAAILAASAHGIVIHAPSGSNFDFGNPKCPCVGVLGMEGTTEVKISSNATADYPADFGARCAAWDNKRNKAFCMPGQKPGADNGWCAEPFCYVDPCNCDLDVPPTKSGSYLPNASYQGKGIWYSYVTCGGKDYWLDAETKKKNQEANGVCEKKPDEKKWGKASCRCVGYEGAPGTVNITLNKKEVQYPTDTGATCESWDAKTHPDCTGDKPADWCKQAWCYVDPCECDLDPDVQLGLSDLEAVNGRP